MMKASCLGAFAAIFWCGTCVLCTILPSKSHSSRNLLELGGEKIDASFIVYIFTESTACSGFIFKHGYALTSADCAKDGDHVTVCRQPDPKTKKCKKGTELGIKQVVTKDEATVLVLADKAIRGLEIEYSIPTKGTKCKAIGFSGGVTDVVAQPNGFVSTVSSADPSTITLMAAEGKDVCLADLGGPLVCNGKGVGLFAETHKDCSGNKPNKAITLRKLRKLIDSTVLGDGTDKPGNAPHIGYSCIMFPIFIAMLVVM